MSWSSTAFEASLVKVLATFWPCQGVESVDSREPLANIPQQGLLTRGGATNTLSRASRFTGHSRKDHILGQINP
ncbi:hypothetical protein QBC37DRAFT_205474 [Rhypophila decipiens]|uniref:Uncharacterized protein n=1 Tax=Rhypophila decipiens TaxID=261697 RepID=A0AAN7B680_9PEZI|nr:hypothetical protein QBC37DRAFT_205474 [Rhypophila decipiens]